MSSDTHPATSQSQQRTPLHGLHVDRGARMVAFAGYDMPLHYAPGLLKEHLHVRAAAGLFDVSHMGQIAVSARSGALTDAAKALEQLMPVDVLGLAPGRQRYAFFTNESGGLLDDLMIANLGDHLLLVVNAACKAADALHLKTHLSDSCEIEPLDRALIALQGPHAEAALARLAPDCAAMKFLDVRRLTIMGASCIVARSGYTGEDGFEIAVPADIARELAEALLEDTNVQLVGLGARDSLRLEAGLCLYGADIDQSTTPVEAGLVWAIQGIRRRNGARTGGFPGAAIVQKEIEKGTARRRVGLRPEGRAPVRAGAPLFRAETGGEAIGAVTSGGFGPSVNAPVAMGYLPSALAIAGTKIWAEVRGKRLAVTVSELPFIPPNVKRG